MEKGERLEIEYRLEHGVVVAKPGTEHGAGHGW